MTAVAERTTIHVLITRADINRPILAATGRTQIAIRAGTTIEINGQAHSFDVETPVEIADLSPGRDYAVGIGANGQPFVDQVSANPMIGDWIAGFHFAPGGNAEGMAGGDAVPAINPNSIWDMDFRPACPDPRGMTLVEMDSADRSEGGKRFWADIYLLGVDHDVHGTSRCGATIADGRDRPKRPAGGGTFSKLDYATAQEIYAHHGKRLLGAEEFFAAAYGVEERCYLEDEPRITGDLSDEAHRFISKSGVIGATGTMWQWGTDGHPDIPRPSIFGGSWVIGSVAGSRYANLGAWPEHSSGHISARGACDHLSPV